MDFHKPGPNKRVTGFLIDAVIVNIFALILGAVLMIFRKRGLVFLSYNLIWAAGMLFKDCFNGRSFGKVIVGTQVIDESGAPAKPARTMIRNILLAIPVFFPFLALYEYNVMLRDKGEGKRPGDKALKTKVTDLKPQLPDALFFWMPIVFFAAAVVFLGLYAFWVTSKRAGL